MRAFAGTRLLVMHTFLKRSLDIVIATGTLLFFAPAMLAIALAIRFFLKEAAIFKQTRIGRGGRPFELVKFRTMRTLKDSDNSLLPDIERMTPFGKLLRAASLDELPQLWNVLRGEMSLVGPRPLLPQYLPRYSAHQARRHEVLPGITGWSQVSGRNGLTWSRRFDLDVWYVDHWSLWLDLEILFLTISTVLRREGVAHPGEATMTEFMGSEKD